MKATNSTAAGPTSRRGRGRGGRPPKTSRTQLLDAALTHGFRGLTVTVLTTAVGVKYSTFYRHFGSINACAAAAVDACLADLTWPDTDHWRAHLRQLAAALAELAGRRDGFAETVAILTHDPDISPPARLEQARAHAVAVLVAAGFTEGDARHGVRAVISCALHPADPASAEPVELLLDGLARRHDRQLRRHNTGGDTP